MGQPLEGDAQNIAIYELLPDLQGDPFIVDNHIPKGLEQWRGLDRRKRRGVPDICNSHCLRHSASGNWM